MSTDSAPFPLIHFLRAKSQTQRVYGRLLWAAAVLIFLLSWWLYKRYKQPRIELADKRTKMPTPILLPPPPMNSPTVNLVKPPRPRRRKTKEVPIEATRCSKPSPPKKAKRSPPIARPASPPRVKQPFDAFLVLDVEATCMLGTGFDWPNEIIEWPVCLMRWKYNKSGNIVQLEVVDTFRSFVKPTWRPQLSPFCTQLTGITQEQVDCAPSFPEVLKSFSGFLAKHGLVDAVTGERLMRFCWCSDGPFDIRDFVAKQCFISKITKPQWLRGDVLDVRMMVMIWLNSRQSTPSKSQKTRPPLAPWRRSLNISGQLQALGLSPFEGREHSGIDDTRNIARILIELARRGVQLNTNTIIPRPQRWIWMGKPGEILEEYCPTP